MLRVSKIINNAKLFAGVCAMIFAISAFSLQAEEFAILKGKVIDKENGDALVGATIRIKDSKMGAFSKIDGTYRIAKLKPGTYTAIFSYLGYKNVEVKDISVKEGEVKSIDISLESATIHTEDVIVSAKRVNETGAALLKERQKASSVSDAIGAKEIARSGGSDAASAIKSMTGATTVGGKYVYIRGLGDRYSSAQLNGANLPSADPDKKSVQLDLFPTSIIENIVTTKTATPDKPGNFTGGTVNIATKSFPDKFNMKFSMKSSYNDRTTGTTMLTQNHSGTSWLGMDGGMRDIPDIVKNSEIPDLSDARRASNPEAALKLDEISKAFSSEMAPGEKIAPVNSSFSFSVGDNLMDNKLGYLASISYNNNYSNYDGSKVAKYSRSGSQSEELYTDYSASSIESKEEVNWGGLANISYNISSSDRVSFNYMYNRSGETRSIYQDGFNAYHRINTETYILSYTERDLSSFQLSGQHTVPLLNNAKLDWRGSYAINNQDEPDFRTFDNMYEEVEVDGEIVREYDFNSSDNNALPSRYFREMQENLGGTTFDLEIPLSKFNKNDFKIKTGFLYNNTERTFSENRFVYANDADDVKFNGDPNSYISDSVGISDWRSSGKWNYFTTYIEDRTQLAGSYTGTQTIAATYAMTDLYLLPELRFVGGFRFETTNLETISKDTTKTSGLIDEQDILPSINLTYQLVQNMNLRFAYGKTLARPTFREIAPYDSYMPIKHSVFIGNPDLERTIINNFDLRWEWFTNPGELLSVSAFYKDFKNPIELAIVNANKNYQAKNVDEATVMGLEFEFRKSLGFIDMLKNFQFGMNLTLVKSEVALPEFEYENRKAYDSTASKYRELQGQSPYVVNLDLAYVNPNSGTDIGLHYNIFGKRLSEVGYGTADYFEHPRPELSLSASQSVFDKFKLKLSISNILDSKYWKAATFRGVDYISEQYYRGRSISFSISYQVK